MFNAVTGALTVNHTSPRTNQLDEPGVVNSEMTISQVSQVPAQIQGPGAVVKNTLATAETTSNYT